MNKVIRDNSLLVFPLKHCWMLQALSLSLLHFLSGHVCVLCVCVYACVCPLVCAQSSHSYSCILNCDLACWTTTVSVFFCFSSLVSHQPCALSFGRKPSGLQMRLPGKWLRKVVNKWRSNQRPDIVNTAVCFCVFVDLMPSLQAVWCPLRPGATVLLHYSPLATQDRASSTDPAGPGVSTSVSQASSVSRTEHRHFLFVRTNQMDLRTERVTTNSWLPAKATRSRLWMLF